MQNAMQAAMRNARRRRGRRAQPHTQGNPSYAHGQPYEQGQGQPYGQRDLHAQRDPHTRDRPYAPKDRRARRDRHAPLSASAKGDFPSRTAAHLAGLTDRAGRLADRLLPRPAPAANTTAERALDLALGTALLLLTAPAVAVAALALTLRRTPGGAWERRPRAGLHGRVFTLRTLRTRRFRLDALSRLPHVVRGDLALVGPAPLAPGNPRPADPRAQHWRRELRPGLTGLAQVRARSGMPWDDPALLDQHYAEHHGVVLDLAILAEAARDCLRTALPGGRRTKAHLSDTDHRPPGCSGVD